MRPSSLHNRTVIPSRTHSPRRRGWCYPHAFDFRIASDRGCYHATEGVPAVDSNVAWQGLATGLIRLNHRGRRRGWHGARRRRSEGRLPRHQRHLLPAQRAGVATRRRPHARAGDRWSALRRGAVRRRRGTASLTAKKPSRRETAPMCVVEAGRCRTLPSKAGLPQIYYRRVR